MKNKLPNAFFALSCALLALAGLAFLGFIIYVKVAYWNVPLGDVPSWALPFLR